MRRVFMLFCPNCGSILLPKKNSKKGLVCNCGYSSKEVNMVIKERNVVKSGKIGIVDKNVETLPKTEEECAKCGNKEAYYWTVQTRAADEAETRFFKCTKCGHIWRSYD